MGAKEETSRNRRQRPFDAATVEKRWWEAHSSTTPASAPAPAAPGVGPAPAPPPPPPAAAEPAAAMSAVERARIQQLEQELAAARDEASALHEMLEDLPEIFERKFRQRLHGILEQQQLLLSDNQALHERLHALQPANSGPEPHTPLLLPAAAEGAAEPESRAEPAAGTVSTTAASPSPQAAATESASRPEPGGTRRRRLGSLLWGVLRLGRSPGRPARRHNKRLSDSSDERPTAA
jgi:hypothetical protein